MNRPMKMTAANSKIGVCARLAKIITGCCTKGVTATAKTNNKPYFSKNSNVKDQVLVSLMLG